MLIIPAIDLRGGKCVRLTQGRKDAVQIYDADPVAVAEGFQDDAAQMLHIVDLDAAFSEPNDRNRQVLRTIIQSIDIPIQIGGGIRTRKEIEQYVELGVTRLIIGTVAVESPDLLAKFIDLFGPKHIAVAIDAKHGRVVTRGWVREERLDSMTLGRRVAAAGVERVVYTDIQRDGTCTGPNIEHTCLIAKSGLKVTASGGVSCLEDLKRLKAVSDCGIDSVIVGKALYEKRFTLQQALAAVD